MSEKWTHGEWRAEEGTTLIWGACDPDDQSSNGYGFPIAECRTSPAASWAKGPSTEEGIANAHMMKASRDLYKALNQCQQILDILARPRDEVKNSDAINAWAQCIDAELKARKALAKARGESND